MTTFWWLAGLFASAFSSATILPGNSEAVFAAALHFQPSLWLLAWVVASMGNILGGLLTVWLARRLPEPRPSAKLAPYVARASRLGPVSLLLTWVPLFGDALCALAGYLRWPWWPVLVFISIGKIARYGVIAWLAL